MGMDISNIISIVIFIVIAVGSGTAIYSHLKSQDSMAQSLKEINANLKEISAKIKMN